MSFLSSAVFILPVILYLIIIGVIIWLIMRLIRATEKIAFNTERIASALSQRNKIEGDKNKE
jgi:CHASE3 domain sensor protein